MIAPLMRQSTRRVVTVLAVVATLLVATASTVTARPTSARARSAGPPAATARPAAVGCHGLTCTGKDPVTMNCVTDAQVRQGFEAELGNVSLLYSHSCDAGWAELSGIPSNNNIPVQMGVFYAPQNGGDPVYGTRELPAGPAASSTRVLLRTNLVSWSYAMKACYLYQTNTNGSVLGDGFTSPEDSLGGWRQVSNTDATIAAACTPWT